MEEYDTVVAASHAFAPVDARYLFAWTFSVRYFARPRMLKSYTSTSPFPTKEKQNNRHPETQTRV